MKIIVKQLQGSECNLEVTPTTSILEMKQEIANKLNIPIADQRLLLLGRALVDEQTISSYPTIKDGTKLNVAVKKPDSLYDVAVKEYKKMGMTDAEAARAASRLLVVMKEKMEQLSWDDMNRLCLDFLLVKLNKRHLRSKRENVEDGNAL